PATADPHPEAEDIIDFVRSDEPWPSWIEGLRRLALRPLSTALDLERAFADIVHDQVAGDSTVGIVYRVEIAGPVPDHDAQLDLPVQLRRAARGADGVHRPA